MKKIIHFSFFSLVCIFMMMSCKKTDSGTGINVNAVIATVSTVAATNIASPTATAGGAISVDGGAIVMGAGVCYDTVAGVTISKHPKMVYTVSGNFSVTLDSLVMGKNYYYKAFAINAAGVAYGTEMSFYVPYSINGYFHTSQVAASNLLAHWSFENGYIDSVSNTVGTPNHTSAISFVNGIKGKAVEVASPGYINSNMTNTVANLQNFTITCWMKHPATVDPTGANFTYIPFSLNNAGFSWEQTKLFMLINNADNVAGTYGKVCLMDQWFDAGQSWPAMLDGKWHHMSITFNGTSGAIRVYVDGTLLAATSAKTFGTQTNFGTANSFTLGGVDDNAHTANGWMNSLSGDLDEFRVYSRDLTGTEVQSIYILEGLNL